MGERTDFELLSAWREGDKVAGNELVRRHFSGVYRFFRSKLGDGVEDLTQQTFLGAVEGRDTFRGEGSFKAYLFGIARRQLMLRLRKSYRAGKVFAATDVSIRDLARDSGPSPSRLLAEQHEHRLLLTALRSIPVDFQIVVELFYWEGMSVGEIAQVVEVAPGTVKSRLSRARQMLQRKLDELMTSEGGDPGSVDDVERWVSSLQGALSRSPDS